MSVLLLLVCMSLLCSGTTGGWRPCTDLLPLDFLSRVLPPGGEPPLPEVHMVQSRGARGLQLTGSQEALSFPASQLFTNCDHFPSEFSFVVTLKIPRLANKRNEYIFSLVEEESDRLLIGLLVSQERLHFLFQGPTVKKRITFRAVRLADNHWHTVVLAVTGRYATLRVDCGMALELVYEKPFPSDLCTAHSRFYIGSRRRWKGLFSGLLRQLVLLPGSDATSRVCPSSDPRLAVLSVPQALLTMPITPTGNDIVPLYPYEAEVFITPGTQPPCAKAEEGQLWFNTLKKGLFLCDGRLWMPLLQEKERLDYVEDYQDLYTNSETFDIEVFHIPSQGLFAATANRETNPGSGIYKWVDGKFQVYQNIITYEARAWKYFTVGNKMFLAVANSKGQPGRGVGGVSDLQVEQQEVNVSTLSDHRDTQCSGLGGLQHTGTTFPGCGQSQTRRHPAAPGRSQAPVPPRDEARGSWSLDTVYPVGRLTRRILHFTKVGAAGPVGQTLERRRTSFLDGTLRRTGLKTGSMKKQKMEEEQMLEMWVKEETSATRTSIVEKWSRLQGLDQHTAMLKYMNIIKEWPGYGSTLFDVECKEGGFPHDLWLSVSAENVSVYKRGEPKPLETFPYEHIIFFGSPQATTYKITVDDRDMFFETPLVGEITKIMKAYINMIVKKRCSVRSGPSYGTNWIR
ncbi:thrombospondin-type laminin G domain and EAR repeat-containing protein-like [Oncorhynchus tshawytscha]|uniref:thrombospondin-type laminin G domain and EAR repeat-containing protein-like n=1 Tax=Oncorhynchus tshawytscha TaxID=74940 RepID=UPI001C3DD7EC|nr:thrombospondin-type laminin G domain and EAR repeat-containing protein-like [Oncorhynchus tshawytscha]